MKNCQRAWWRAISNSSTISDEKPIGKKKKLHTVIVSSHCYERRYRVYKSIEPELGFLLPGLGASFAPIQHISS